MRRLPLDLPGRYDLATATPGRPRSDASGGEIIDLASPEAAMLLRGGMGTSSGAVVGIETAMKVSTAWRCLHLIAGGVGNLPIDLYRRISEGDRQPAVGHPVRDLLSRRPNGWQTSAEFRKMLTAHAVMKGNGYGIKVTSRGRTFALWPVRDPDRMQVAQRADMTLAYRYTRMDGSQVELEQADVLHLRGLTWDGIRGVGVLRHAREAMGLSLQVEQAGARLFRQGMIGGKVFARKSGGTLSQEAFDRLKQQLDELHAGAENAHKSLILEDGLESDGELMTAEDMQFLGLRDFQRSDVAVFMGVPPHMAGIMDKTTSWGTGMEQQSTGFVQYTLDDWMVMWEQGCGRDLLNPVTEADLYVRINRTALLRGDMDGRSKYYSRALGAGGSQAWMSADEVRGLEELNAKGGDAAELPKPTNVPGKSNESLDDRFSGGKTDA